MNNSTQDKEHIFPESMKDYYTDIDLPVFMMMNSDEGLILS